ncbi:type II toxin-antitoxin system RnlA family toxin [Grimontia marina]|uniref:mRNA endoribonuclease LsoA n=1 Tax=Grimontia marina TaxID=646534 RepID=A0A128FIZ3_9GAMM|nr:type II toxin-antitoxin system RnlA family toxin [Grimontia marina]CZF86749.1 mRNA endoribonuclease LsoA [Grimontia marina]
MTYTNIALDRSLIENALRSHPEFETLRIVDAGKNCQNIFIQLKGEPTEALIRFFFKDKGRTTLLPQGANLALSNKLAGHVVENCQITVASRESFSIRNLNAENMDLLLEYLVTECHATVTTSEIPYGQKHKVIGCQGDDVTLTYYDKGTFMIQGSPVLLHNQVIEFLCEFLELRDIVQSQLNLVKTGIKAEEILGEMSATLPYSFDELDAKIKAIISPSLALVKLDIELTDYTVFAFPALRGLEGYVKGLFASKGIVIGKQGFAPHLHEVYHATLSEEAREKIDCEKTCTAINQCYGYYKDQRHGLFHANGILANTRVLTDRAEAVNVVNDVLLRIEQSHTLIRGL